MPDFIVVYTLADDWQGHAPYWGFNIYQGKIQKDALKWTGSADDLNTAGDMVKECIQQTIAMENTPHEP